MGFRCIGLELADTVERKELRAANSPGLFLPGCNLHFVLRCTGMDIREKGPAVMAVSALTTTEDDPSKHKRNGRAYIAG